MPIEEVKLSLKEKTLAGLRMGNPVIDHLVKLALEPKDTNIKVGRLVVFDGLSTRSLSLDSQVRDRMTIRNAGKVSQSPRDSLGGVAEETIDAGAQMGGVGSVLQIKKIGLMLLKHAGLITHDGVRTYKAALKLDGKEIGEAIYTVYKYNSLQDLPPSVTNTIPESERDLVLKKPALMTKALVDIDLTNAPTNKEGFVQLRLGENIDIGNLSRDHARNVIITAFYNISVGSLPNVDSATKNTTQENHVGNLSLDFGPLKFDTIQSQHE